MLFFYIFAGAVFLFGVIFILYRNKKSLQEKELLEKQIELEKEYYKTLEESQNLIGTMRTEIASYIQEMRKMGEADSMTMELMKKYERIPQVEFSRHPIINAVAYDKMKKAEELGVKLEYDCMTLPEGAISDADLISLMGNLLDNALEAVQRLPETEREILFAVKEKKGALLFSCKNRKSKDEKPVREGFISKKADSVFHGLGRKIIREIVEKYQGVLDDKDTGEWLETEVLLMERNVL